MNLKKTVVIFVCIYCLGGCANTTLQEVHQTQSDAVIGDHPLDIALQCDDNTWLPYRTCGSHFFECENQNPWSDDSRQVIQAAENFEYAMMASNSYKHDPTTINYFIPRWTQVSRLESDSGLAIDVYEQIGNDDAVREVAIVYEGTNFSNLSDWKFNFALVQPNQFKEALSHAQSIRNQYGKIPITAIGHSLGGGLALNISMLVDDVKGVAFNSSPRAFWGEEDQDNGNPRIHLYEVGEILGPLTRTYLRLRLSGGQMLPVRYNFLDYTNVTQAISEHSMYNLSRGLILVAIKAGDKNAIEAFVQNIGEEKAKIDGTYCPLIFDQASRKSITAN